MRRHLLYLGAAALAIGGLMILPGPWTEVRDILVAVVGSVILFYIDRARANWRYIRLWFSIMKVRREQVRVSASYLYRIKCDARFLLIRGKRIPDQFQPVGGVYKRYPDATGILAKLKVKDDVAIPIDDSSRDDLRVRVPATELLAFVRWYQAKEGREVETWREFSEELVGPGLLPSATFPHLHVHHVAQRITGVRWSAYLQTYELLIADILDVHWSAAQEQALRSRKSQSHPDLVWATEQQIRSRGWNLPDDQVRISESADWLL